MGDSTHRSFEQITRDDLARLAQIARADFADLCQRQEYSLPYADRLGLLCLCQGAARHYVYGDRGVHDFDVWGFFEAIDDHPFPYRRIGKQDFGLQKFGWDPDDDHGFEGRCVDVIGRSISMAKNETPIESVRRYLREKRTTSANFLAKRPVVALWPEKYFDQVIWDALPVA